MVKDAHRLAHEHTVEQSQHHMTPTIVFREFMCRRNGMTQWFSHTSFHFISFLRISGDSWLLIVKQISTHIPWPKHQDLSIVSLYKFECVLYFSITLQQVRSIRHFSSYKQPKNINKNQSPKYVR